MNLDSVRAQIDNLYGNLIEQLELEGNKESRFSKIGTYLKASP